MTSVKLVFGEEIRRCTIGADGERLRFDNLIKTVYELMPALRDATITFQWTDDEGDLVTISMERELQEAIRVSDSARRLLRLNINPVRGEAKGTSALPKAAVTVEHTHVTCDECGLSPIKGIRYKCTVREDFDLCETCEAKNPQPYPMIKITDPAQAPHLLVYGFNDQGHGGRGGGRGHCGGRGGGGWWRRGMPHPHHGPGFHGSPPGPAGHMPPPPFGGPLGHCPEDRHQGPPPPRFDPQFMAAGPRGPSPSSPGFHGPPPPHHMPSGPFGCPFFSAEPGCDSTTRFMERKAERLAKRLEKVQSHLKTNIAAPLAAAVDAFFSSDSPAAEASPATAAAPGAAAAPANGNGELEDEMIEQAIRESLSINESDRPVHIETAPAAVASLPKPALRYVKDVTFPDNSMVQPGMVFRKVWRVRNDGKHPWPADASLVSSGGDMLSAQDIKEPLPQLPPDEEAEIAVTLTAPVAHGLYTSYFRAQTKEGQHFGHRLWTAVVVADAEPDWTVLSASASASASPVEAVPVPAPIMMVSQAKDVKMVEECKDVEEDEDMDEIMEASEHQLTASQLAGNAPEPPSNQLQSLALLWRREVEILGDMGFHDLEVMLPLLQTHLACPLSLSADKNGTPRVEGMQQVVASLLSQTFSRDV